MSDSDDDLLKEVPFNKNTSRQRKASEKKHTNLCSTFNNILGDEKKSHARRQQINEIRAEEENNVTEKVVVDWEKHSREMMSAGDRRERQERIDQEKYLAMSSLLAISTNIGVRGCLNFYAGGEFGCRITSLEDACGKQKSAPNPAIDKLVKVLLKASKEKILANFLNTEDVTTYAQSLASSSTDRDIVPDNILQWLISTSFSGTRSLSYNTSSSSSSSSSPPSGAYLSTGATKALSGLLNYGVAFLSLAEFGDQLVNYFGYQHTEPKLLPMPNSLTNDDDDDDDDADNDDNYAADGINDSNDESQHLCTMGLLNFFNVWSSAFESRSIKEFQTTDESIPIQLITITLVTVMRLGLDLTIHMYAGLKRGFERLLSALLMSSIEKTKVNPPESFIKDASSKLISEFSKLGAGVKDSSDGGDNNSRLPLHLAAQNVNCVNVEDGGVLRINAVFKVFVSIEGLVELGCLDRKKSEEKNDDEEEDLFSRSKWLGLDSSAKAMVYLWSDESVQFKKDGPRFYSCLSLIASCLKASMSLFNEDEDINNSNTKARYGIYGTSENCSKVLSALSSIHKCCAKVKNKIVSVYSNPHLMRCKEIISLLEVDSGAGVGELEKMVEEKEKSQSGLKGFFKKRKVGEDGDEGECVGDVVKMKE